MKKTNLTPALVPTATPEEYCWLNEVVGVDLAAMAAILSPIIAGETYTPTIIPAEGEPKLSLIAA
ncbi:hypothetical protein ABC337_13915 [Arthrobacter sp. 1P04PC]|uniref:hypothetical protein n=1 Tax=unclassified Arthrobacter TaxID=235627 RepID=UPI0039A1DBF4